MARDLKLKLHASVDLRFNHSLQKTANSFKDLAVVLNKIDKRSRFEKFYDFMTDLLSDGRSFVPKELKSF